MSSNCLTLSCKYSFVTAFYETSVKITSYFISSLVLSLLNALLALVGGLVGGVLAGLLTALTPLLGDLLSILSGLGVTGLLAGLGINL